MVQAYSTSLHIICTRPLCKQGRGGGGRIIICHLSYGYSIKYYIVTIVYIPSSKISTCSTCSPCHGRSGHYMGIVPCAVAHLLVQEV
ncbi:hypothetical protein FKM82_021648 [Ascaphus truei]